MKKLLISILSAFAIVSCSGSFNKEQVTVTANKLFSCAQENKWTVFHSIYPESEKFSIHNFINYTIAEDMEYIKDKGVCVNVDLEYLTYKNAPSSHLKVKLYFEKDETNENYIVKDSENLGVFDTGDAIYKYALNTGCLNELEDISDVQIATKLIAAKEMADYYFNKIKNDLANNLAISKRWTEVCYAGQTHYEYARVTNNSQYDIKRVKYRTKKNGLDYGYVTLQGGMLKSHQSRDFMPYEYAVYDKFDTVTVSLYVDDSVIWDLVKAKEFTGNEYNEYLNEIKPAEQPAE